MWISYTASWSCKLKKTYSNCLREICYSVYVKSCEQENLMEIGCIAIFLQAPLVTELKRYLILSSNKNIHVTKEN